MRLTSRKLRRRDGCRNTPSALEYFSSSSIRQWPANKTFLFLPHCPSSRGLGSGCSKAPVWRRQMGCCQLCLLHQVLLCSCVGSVLWLHRAGANSPLAITASLASPAPDMLESKGRYTCLCSFYVSFHLPSLISPLEAGLAVSKEVWSVSEISFILKRSPENFPLDTAMWNRTSERAPVLQSDMLIIFTFRSLNIFSIPPFHCSNTLAQP